MLLFITSLLALCLDPLSMQLPYRYYIREHCLKRRSNYDKNSRRTNVSNVVLSSLWHHRVTWRHRWRHQSNAHGHFPI